MWLNTLEKNAVIFQSMKIYSIYSIFNSNIDMNGEINMIFLLHWTEGVRYQKSKLRL